MRLAIGLPYGLSLLLILAGCGLPPDIVGPTKSEAINVRPEQPPARAQSTEVREGGDVSYGRTASPLGEPVGRYGLELIDLTGDIDRIWNATAALPDDVRVARFKADFANILPGFYDHRRFEGLNETDYDRRLLNGLNAYPAQREGIARVSRGFTSLMAPAQRSFEDAFGPMTGYPPFYLLVSFGEFDGGTRTLPEGTRLLFGADVIDRVHGTGPLQPFFHHELFHILHRRMFGECAPVWCSLWTEGLAVYVASRLNPDADDAALLLTIPVPLREAVETNRKEAVCAVRSRLTSSEPSDHAPLFRGGGTPVSPKMPSRFAYYVGYLIAQDIGRDRSLNELASLAPEQVRPLIEQSLDRMADCSTAPR